jgi:hypothetical protein
VTTSSPAHSRHQDENQRALAGAKAKALFEEEARAQQGKKSDLFANLQKRRAEKTLGYLSKGKKDILSFPATLL